MLSPTRRFTRFALAAVVFPLAAQAAPLELSLQTRTPAAAGEFTVTQRLQQWQPKETAIIVCDMWDRHHCLNAVRRETELAPRVDQFLEKARAQGVFIIHAPSSCMAFYEGQPGRVLAQSAPQAPNLPKDIGSWCKQLPLEAQVEYPLDQSDSEDDDPAEHAKWAEELTKLGLNPKAPWKRQTKAIEIREGDAITDSGVEIWNLLEARGIRNVMLTGVHVNMCVSGRPFGLRQLGKNGKNVVLVRDLTDSMYNPKQRPFVDHYRGTALYIEYVEKYLAPTITSDQLLGGQPFRFSAELALAKP